MNPISPPQFGRKKLITERTKPEIIIMKNVFGYVEWPLTIFTARFSGRAERTKIMNRAIGLM